jgi:phage terminase small subunit
VSNQRHGLKPGPKARRPFTRAIATPDEPGSKSSAPACPANLTEPQKTAFRTVVRELSATPGLLRMADRAALIAFAIHTSNFRIAQRHVDVEGAVVSGKVSAWAIEAAKQSSLATALGDRLSLNPAARETLHVPSPPPQGGLPDPLMPPRSHFEHVKLERTLSTLTETVFQDPEPPGLFDVMADVSPDLPDPVDQDSVVPVVEPEPAAEPGPAGIPLEAVQPQGEAVAEKPTRPESPFHFIGKGY